MFINLGADFMEKCYTIREFLLSLRNEYLQNQKALNHLKNYIMIMNKKVENFRLSIGEEEIIAYIKRREIALDRILNRCLKKNNKEIKELIYNSEEFLSLKNLRIYPSEISTFSGLSVSITANDVELLMAPKI